MAIKNIANTSFCNIIIPEHSYQVCINESKCYLLHMKHYIIHYSIFHHQYHTHVTLVKFTAVNTSWENQNNSPATSYNMRYSCLTLSKLSFFIKNTTETRWLGTLLKQQALQTYLLTLFFTCWSICAWGLWTKYWMSCFPSTNLHELPFLVIHFEL